MPEIRINDKMISQDSAIFFVAEIGINHNGDIKLAKKLIDMASFCGADSVKFQKRTLEICIPHNIRNRIRETPWGEMTYSDHSDQQELFLWEKIW